MLTFTTETRPHSMLEECGPFLSNPINPIRKGFSDKVRLNLYLHGTLQEKAGFDIAYHIDDVFELKTDIVPCLVNLGTRYSTLRCIMYLWQARNIFADTTLQNWMGLIVEPNDAAGSKYALDCFIEKRPTL